jgi:hypothetical protein
MSSKKVDSNEFDGLVAIQLNTRSWPVIVNLTKEDLGLDKVEAEDAQRWPSSTEMRCYGVK